MRMIFKLAPLQNNLTPRKKKDQKLKKLILKFHREKDMTIPLFLGFFNSYQILTRNIKHRRIITQCIFLIKTTKKHCQRRLINSLFSFNINCSLHCMFLNIEFNACKKRFMKDTMNQEGSIYNYI